MADHPTPAAPAAAATTSAASTPSSPTPSAPNSRPDTDHEARVRALFALSMAEVRESVGIHAYDGLVQDLSVAGVAAALAEVGPARPDDAALPHDERHLRAFERAAHVTFGDDEAHRHDPLPHISNLDLAGYDRAYAPEEERRAARARHLAAWPEAIDASVGALDAVTAPVAKALLGAARGLSEGVAALAADPADPLDEATAVRALAAHERFVAHLEESAEKGDPDCAIGAERLARQLGTVDAVEIDLTELAARAEAERDRLTLRLADACGRQAPGRTVSEIIPELLADHPDLDGVLTHAREVTREVLEFTAQHGLVPDTDGICEVGPAPASRSWAMAMMCWAAPEEDDAPSQYYVTPPDPSWPEEEISEWLSVFSRTTLPTITVHEVAPGHYTHGRSLRRAPSLVRRGLQGYAFCEGWAHYVEEMVMEVGFRADDPRYEIGMCIEALLRVTRLSCAIGLHTGAMTVDDATERFRRDAHLTGAAARSEANRGTFDIGYGRYTWGKLEILAARERAREAWGAQFSLARFHTALMAAGSPPIGLLDSALAL